MPPLPNKLPPDPIPPFPTRVKPRPVRHVLPLLVTLGAVLVLAILLLIFRQPLQDWWRLRGYEPPASVAKLADQDTMNSYTRHLFYLNKPQLLGTVKSFRQFCPENKNTIVLGCYHPDQAGIFIYNVADPSLAGVQQVTAAHEVLHAVYARLNSKERQDLNNQLNAFYKHGLTDQRVLAEVKIYQQTEPHDVMDEMSCTFGTELSNLPAGLDAYYRKYFTNRAAIVAYEQRYQAAFSSRQAIISNDDHQLTAMKSQIDAQEASLTFQLNQINSDQSHLNNLLSSGQTDAYNAAVPGFNNEVKTYNSGIGSLHSLIDSYNQLVSARNAIAGQLTTLDSAIDTRLAPQSAR